MLDILSSSGAHNLPAECERDVRLTVPTTGALALVAHLIGAQRVALWPCAVKVLRAACTECSHRNTHMQNVCLLLSNDGSPISGWRRLRDVTDALLCPNAVAAAVELLDELAHGDIIQAELGGFCARLAAQKHPRSRRDAEPFKLSDRCAFACHACPVGHV